MLPHVVSVVHGYPAEGALMLLRSSGFLVVVSGADGVV